MIGKYGKERKSCSWVPRRAAPCPLLDPQRRCMMTTRLALNKKPQKGVCILCLDSTTLLVHNPNYNY